MAKALVRSMSSNGIRKNTRMIIATLLDGVIEEKVESGGKEIEEKPKAKKPSSKVIDLVAVLQESLAKSEGGRRRSARPGRQKERPQGGLKEPEGGSGHLVE